MTQLDTRSTDAGTRVVATAESLKKIAAELQSDELSRGAASLATRGAENLQRIGDYLKGSDGERLVSDAERFGRSRPWAVATSGFLLGLAGSRMLKASALRRSVADPDSFPYDYDAGSTSQKPVTSGLPYGSVRTQNSGLPVSEATSDTVARATANITSDAPGKASAMPATSVDAPVGNDTAIVSAGKLASAQDDVAATSGFDRESR